MVAGLRSARLPRSRTISGRTSSTTEGTVPARKFAGTDFGVRSGRGGNRLAVARDGNVAFLVLAFAVALGKLPRSYRRSPRRFNTAGAVTDCCGSVADRADPGQPEPDGVDSDRDRSGSASGPSEGLVPAGEPGILSIPLGLLGDPRHAGQLRNRPRRKEVNELLARNAIWARRRRGAWWQQHQSGLEVGTSPVEKPHDGS